MRFLKESLIIVLIVLSIIGIDIILENHFYKEKCEIEEIIDEVENIIAKGDNVTDKVDELYQKWFNFEYIASYYVEHDELEKVALQICLVKKTVEIEEFSETEKSLTEIKYLIDHIFEKDKLKLKNIF